MDNPLERLRIVLVNTSHPGNIGAVARAMKTMGLSQLALVAPKVFPSAEASARASGADDLLARAQVHDDLDAALEGCHWVLGASARLRKIPVPPMLPRESARMALQECARGDVALVFGREQSGLSNEELDRCHALVNIPTDPVYGSLNIAMAVQVLAYELRMGYLDGLEPIDSQVEVAADAQDMERFYEHLEQVLIEIEFLNPERPRKLMRRLRRLYQRARPDQNEMNILRGILTATQKANQGRS